MYDDHLTPEDDEWWVIRFHRMGVYGWHDVTKEVWPGIRKETSDMVLLWCGWPLSSVEQILRQLAYLKEQNMDF